MPGYPIPTASPADEPLTIIAVNEQWWSFLFGGLQTFTYPGKWNGTPEQQAWAVEKVYELMAIGGAMVLFDVRILNNRLEKLVGGEWVDVGAMDQFAVIAGDLPPGSPATATFEDGVITFMIPGGLPGEDGEQGIQGIPGEQGIQGIPGETGATGETGAQGIQGIQGIPGEQGEQGEQGFTGAQGIQGIQGIPGEQGIQGIPGEQGEQGEPGEGVRTAHEDPDNVLDNICAGVHGVYDWAAAKITAICDAAIAEINENAATTQIIIAILEAGSFGVLELAPLDEIVTIAKTVDLAAPTNLKAHVNNINNAELYKEELYCLIKNSYSNGVYALSQASFETWCKTVLPYGTTLLDHWLLGNIMFEVIGYSEFFKRLIIYTRNIDESCELLEWCPQTNCIRWDFLTDDYDWTTVGTSGYGSWFNTIGWVHGNEGGTRRVDIDLPNWANENAITITRVEVDCDFDAGSFVSNQYIAANLVGGGSATILDDNSPLEGTGITVGVDCEIENAINLRVSFQTSDNGGGGSCTIREIRVFFSEGDNPYPELPCEE